MLLGTAKVSKDVVCRVWGAPAHLGPHLTSVNPWALSTPQIGAVSVSDEMSPVLRGSLPTQKFPNFITYDPKSASAL
jgi:hypothetical protein